MNRRILVTSTDLMMVQFLLPHIRNLSENGYEVEITPHPAQTQHPITVP